MMLHTQTTPKRRNTLPMVLFTPKRPYTRKPLPPARQFRQLYELITGLVVEERWDVTVGELWPFIEALKLNHYTLQTPLSTDEMLDVERILIKITGTGEMP